MFAFALAVFKAQAEDAIKMLINRRKSDFFIKTSVGGVAKQPVFLSPYSHIFPASTFVLLLGARRSLRSLHEFSFAHQRVSILLRKNKKTRAVGLFAIALSLQPLPSLSLSPVAAFGVATIPSAF